MKWPEDRPSQTIEICVSNIFPLNFNHKNLATLDFSACLDKDCAFLNQQEGERFGHLEQS